MIHFLFAFALTLGLMVADSQRWAPLVSARAGLYAFFEPVYLGIAWPGSVLDGLGDDLRFGGQLREENQRLREQNLRLAAYVQKLSYLASDNARLRGLIESAGQLRSRVLVAEVIGIDPDPGRDILLINQGKASGLYLGQPILDARGVLGRVIQAGRQTARVMLITDHLNSIPVRINRNGMRAILSGTGDPGELKLQYVPEKSDIKPGDLLVTSGLGHDFPAGYPVGRVTEIRRQVGDQFLDISAVPVAALDRSRYVLALFEKPQSADMSVIAQPLPVPAPVTPVTPAPATVPAAAPAQAPAAAAPSAAAGPVTQEARHAQTP